jgi:hypothetical protein
MRPKDLHLERRSSCTLPKARQYGAGGGLGSVRSGRVSSFLWITSKPRAAKVSATDRDVRPGLLQLSVRLEIVIAVDADHECHALLRYRWIGQRRDGARPTSAAVKMLQAKRMLLPALLPNARE